MQRPVILIGEISELADLLELRGESALRFDAVVGRNALGSIKDKLGAVQSLVVLLQRGSCLSLNETILRDAQRLHELVDLEPLGRELATRVQEAEEQIYADARNPVINWDAHDLGQVFESAGLGSVTVDIQEHTTEMLISAATLERWFSQEASLPRPSYAQHLSQHLDNDELGVLKALFERKLVGQTVPWKTREVFVYGKW